MNRITKLNRLFNSTLNTIGRNNGSRQQPISSLSFNNSQSSYTSLFNNRSTIIAFRAPQNRYSTSNSKEEANVTNEDLKELFRKDDNVDLSSNTNRLFIQTENTPNPDSLKFVPGIEVMPPGKTIDFPDFKSSQISPLANAIFKLDGVNRVFYGPDFISVNKFPEHEWAILKPQVFGAIIDFYHSDKPLLSETPTNENSDTLILPEDDETVAMIKELIETRVRPTLLDDGGNIQYLGFKDGIVLVKLQGTCSSCSSSQATLKGGIERMLMHWISEVRGIMAVTDDELDNLNLEFFKKVDQELEQKQQK
ncbi:NIF system FeS cluster assembly domain-containing protein [Heterostelium album PN500]|uniref:NIF system FeS cluster assembly domain-containing protein n=1 Tax=Heterostelium pallidum (strain ATCC 26659 / Pp 5 / PN500) TaxID=670386 RepID=D3B864_HETP5|nr:NIF system FeS cluster assembly domain-containing protein [Heterostelium album PN500]EFA82232.1 NIF system FeS cluster assembly domain-containing protein [Heterostelium album PN500]|eukprot:XP_020434349.1 NIF system FeS cluster assembly domain-containing protein [Heterostelium album PN500]